MYQSSKVAPKLINKISFKATQEMIRQGFQIHILYLRRKQNDRFEGKSSYERANWYYYKENLYYHHKSF